MAWVTPDTVFTLGQKINVTDMETIGNDLQYLYDNSGEKRKDLSLMAANPPLGTVLPAAAVELVTAGTVTTTNYPAWYQARFDGTVNEGRMWNFSMPMNFAGTPVIKISYNSGTASVAGSTTVWGVQVAAVSNTDLWYGKTFSGDNRGTSTIVGTAYVMNQATVTVLDYDNAVALDNLCVLLYRAGTVDTFNGDAVVTKVEMFYT